MKTSLHILIVADDPKLTELLRDCLATAGHEISVLERGSEVLPWLQSNVADLVLLDPMTLDLRGLTLLRHLRATFNMPVIPIATKVRDIDGLPGPEVGADDYVCEPFNPQALLMRVQALLRRGVAPQPPSVQPIELDLRRFELRVLGQPMAVTPVEFRLLQKLLEHPGRVYSRSQLQAAIYTDHRVVSARTIDTHVRNLRRKFIALGCDPIASVYGVGFRYEWCVVGA
jgi:two-component system response regulator BaeR